MAQKGKVAQIATKGFGDPANDYAWSMAYFNGKLYVGTSRNQACVENATLDYYFPTRGYWKTNPSAGITCPADKYDMDLRAEIWQYDPATSQWTMVYRSPEVPNPRAPGKMIANYIGFRGMVVDNGALYVASVTPDEYIPELAASNPPVLLRTADGTNFTSVGAPTQINYINGPQAPMGLRSLEVVNGTMFLTASGGLTGDGAVMRVDNPEGPQATFTQISPANLQVFELQNYNNTLYAGYGDPKNGYGVDTITFDGSGNPVVTPVVTGGAGRGKAITSVVSMGVFQNQLYVGASGWYTGVLPASEEIRIGPDGTWQLVAGAPRTVNGTTVNPISGLGNGFGNPFNAHFWRQTTGGGAYFVGTNDWSYVWQGFPIVGWLLSPGMGFDMLGTCDGQTWWTETFNAYWSSIYNFGARTMVDSPTGFYIGSANHATGTYIFRETFPTAPCTTVAGSVRNGTATVAGPPAPPRQFKARWTGSGNVLTWRASAGATSYQILRSGYTTVQTVGLAKPPSVRGFQLPSTPTLARGNGTVPISLPLSFKQIGTSTSPTFADTAAPAGIFYRYEVIAVNANGATSPAVVTSPMP